MAVCEVSWHGPEVMYRFIAIRKWVLWWWTYWLSKKISVNFSSKWVLPHLSWHCVCCLYIATRESGNDNHDCGGCHLWCWWSMFSEHCVWSWIILHNVTSDYDPAFVLLILRLQLRILKIPENHQWRLRHRRYHVNFWHYRALASRKPTFASLCFSLHQTCFHTSVHTLWCLEVVCFLVSLLPYTYIRRVAFRSLWSLSMHLIVLSFSIPVQIIVNTFSNITSSDVWVCLVTSMCLSE